MKKAIVAITMLLLAGLGAVAGFLPNVGDGTTPNVWTRNMDGVLAAARQTGHPILLVMVNEDSDGGGCSHCRDFMNRTLNTANFAAIVNDYEFYMVFLNCYGFEMRGALHPQNGDVSQAYFDKYWYAYTVSPYYPLVAVIRPDGTRYSGWSDSTRPATNYYNFHEYLRAAIAALAPKNSIFSLESSSSNVQSVSPAAAASWTGRIVRSGGSGKSGGVAIGLSGANAGNYVLSTSWIDWGTGDGEVPFTVTGPVSFDGGIVDDVITVSIAASGFAGSSIAYGTTAQTIRFKDARIAQTLDEYGAVSGIDGLSAVSGVWYAPASSTDGNVLQTLTKGSSSMVWRPSTGGFVTLSSSAYTAVSVGSAPTVVNKGSLIVSLNGVDYDLAQRESVRLGFSAGDEIVFTATAPVQGDFAEIGLTRFEVSKFTVSILSPANGASLSLPALVGNHALADLSWSANMDCSGYKVFDAAGGLRAETQATSVNGVDIGLVSLTEGAATYNWSVCAYHDCANEAIDNRVNEILTIASSSFIVASSPEFGAMPSVVTVYLKLNTSIDCAARAGSTDGVSYSASGLPKGMKINPSTGLISGIPKKAGTYSVTVTASNGYGSSPFSFTLKVEKQLKAAGANAQLILFDGIGNITGSASLKSTTSGKWTLKTTVANKTTTTKGTLSVSGTGTMLVSGNGVNLAGDVGSGAWSGTVAGYAAYGAKIAKLSKNWRGVWNSGVGTSADSTRAGYVIAKVASGGKVIVAGKIANRVTLSGNGNGVVLSAAFVAANLPAWAGHGDVLFVHLYKKRSLNGGYALFGDGTMRGTFTLGGVAYDKVEGSKWNKSSLARFNGATVSTIGCGNVSFTVSATASSVSAVRNTIGAAASVNKNTGLVKVSYKNGRTSCNGTGVAYVSGGVLQASGGGQGGKSRFSFVIR